MAPVIAAAWGVIFFKAFVHLSWGAALTLALLAALTYAIKPATPAKRNALALLIGLFGGLGAWWAVDLGALSIAVGIAGAGMFLVYMRLQERHR